MKKTIRILALLLVIVTILGAIPAPVSAAEPVIDENSGWYWPTNCGIGKKITSHFAEARTIQGKSDIHQGIDIGVKDGTAVYAAKSGTVYDVGETSALGKYICIYHGVNSNGKYIFSTYQHLSETFVQIGASVNIGDMIAKSGHTGRGTGPHLHFHVFRHNKKDPGPGNVTFPRNKNTVWDIYVDVGRTSMYTSNLNISVTSHPVEIEQGQAWGMRGSVASQYKITRVDGVIYNKDTGLNVMSSVDYPNATHMDIRYSQVNNALIFNNLPAGSYNLKITATDSSGKTQSWNHDFKVYTPFVVIGMSKYPGHPDYKNITKGKCFGLRGWINSSNKITSIKGEIIKHNWWGDSIADTSYDYPYSKDVDVQHSNLNNHLNFNLLKKGDYTLRITVTTSSGQTFTWKSDFKVK